LVDQGAVADDNASFTIPDGAHGTTTLNGQPLRLPVTEDAGAPTIMGAYADGYPIPVGRRVRGSRQGGHLSRHWSAVELTGCGLSRTFVWPRAELTAQLVDQGAVADENASFTIPDGAHGVGTTQGQPLRLPVTEDAGAPTIMGAYADGYPILVSPSINGSMQGGHLFRPESAVELTASGLRRTSVSLRDALPI